MLAYLLLMLLAIAAVGLWLYARTNERHAERTEAEILHDRAELVALLEYAPCGILVLTSAQRVARPASAATRRMLQHGCEAETPFADLLVSVAPEATRLATKQFLAALAGDPDKLDPAANPLATLISGDRELRFRFHRIDREPQPLAILVTIEELKVADHQSARRAASHTPQWLSAILRLESNGMAAFLNEAGVRAAQIRAIVRMPTRTHRAFREKLNKLDELVAALRTGSERIGLQSIADRTKRFDQLLGELEHKRELGGNDFLPLAQALDELLSHFEELRGAAAVAGERERAEAPARTLPIRDLTHEVSELADTLALAGSKSVKVVTVGLEDVPPGLLEPVGDILTQLVHNAVRHGIEAPLERVRAGKPSSGTLIVQFRENPARGYELSLQDDGRGLDYAKLRTVAVEKGVLTPDVAAHIDPRKLASLIFRPGFSTAIYGDSTQQNGIGMDLVRERTHDVGGKVGVATRPGEFTRFRIVLPLTAARRVA
jgi:two-component system, chemotaxis family, sensor kinase CheA